MLEPPGVTRVARRDLFSPSSGVTSPASEDHDAAQARLNAHLAGFFSVSLEAAPLSRDAAAEVGRDGEENQAPNEFEFRLFARSGAATQKVVLPEREEEQSYTPDAGAFTRPRPIACHIRGALAPEERRKISEAALSSHDIREAAQKRAWGLEKPWRVLHIVTSEVPRKRPLRTGERDGVATNEGRKRPGKKRRIAKRREAKAKKEKEARELDAKQAKEDHIKEKKKRLNREKKLKRRQKERDKKIATGPEADSGKGGAERSSACADAEN